MNLKNVSHKLSSDIISELKKVEKIIEEELSGLSQLDEYKEESLPEKEQLLSDLRNNIKEEYDDYAIELLEKEIEHLKNYYSDVKKGNDYLKNCIYDYRKRISDLTDYSKEVGSLSIKRQLSLFRIELRDLIFLREKLKFLNTNKLPQRLRSGITLFRLFYNLVWGPNFKDRITPEIATNILKSLRQMSKNSCLYPYKKNRYDIDVSLPSDLHTFKMTPKVISSSKVHTYTKDALKKANDIIKKNLKEQKFSFYITAESSLETNDGEITINPHFHVLISKFRLDHEGKIEYYNEDVNIEDLKERFSKKFDYKVKITSHHVSKKQLYDATPPELYTVESGLKYFSKPTMGGYYNSYLETSIEKDSDLVEKFLNKNLFLESLFLNADGKSFDFGDLYATVILQHLRTIARLPRRFSSGLFTKKEQSKISSIPHLSDALNSYSEDTDNLLLKIMKPEKHKTFQKHLEDL